MLRTTTALLMIGAMLAPGCGGEEEAATTPVTPPPSASVKQADPKPPVIKSVEIFPRAPIWIGTKTVLVVAVEDEDNDLQSGLARVSLDAGVAYSTLTLACLKDKPSETLSRTWTCGVELKTTAPGQLMVGEVSAKDAAGQEAKKDAQFKANICLPEATARKAIETALGAVGATFTKDVELPPHIDYQVTKTLGLTVRTGLVDYQGESDIGQVFSTSPLPSNVSWLFFNCEGGNVVRSGRYEDVKATDLTETNIRNRTRDFVAALPTK